PGKPSRAAIYAPSSVYLSGEEWLRLTTISNTGGVAVAIRGRVLMPDSTPVPFRDQQIANSNRTVNTSLTALPEGWLLGVEVLAVSGSTPANGSTWVLVELVRGQTVNAEVLQALCSGFITARNPVAWPGPSYVNSLDGQGHLRSITGTTPAAGAEISETV